MKNRWEIKTLADVCTFENGDRGVNYPSKTKRTSKGIPFINAGHFVDNKIDLTNMDYISRERYNLMGRGKIQKGDILFCLRGSLGKFASVGDLPEGQIASSLVIVRHSESVLHEYLLAYFESRLCEENIERYRGGAAQPNLAAKSLTQFTIPIPPLPEQQRIVSLLDETFAALTKVHANAECNQVNARGVFEASISEIFTSANGDWEEKTIEDIADIEYGYTDKAKSTGKFRYIRITDIDKNGNLVPENKVYIGNFKEAKDFLLQDNDLLMARTGATFGKVLLYEDVEPSIFASYLIRIKFNEKILNKFYWYFSKSRMYWEQANQLSSGSAQPQFNGNALKQLVFRYPKSLAEQRAIVQRLDGLAKETRRLEEVYQSKQEAVEELRRSVLQRAFAGEL